ncbi:5'/3'-nucleotidase SurE [Kordiimonas pumila]|uniref:5'-nucleotidase SurE n=1 Tax=Kordiimonas pumila TaxID=2161677 RepID=A0ABV7D969_9PROT|nr:5'/3'-nucleotidase SurE [Kordiimonas pumila]
MIKYILIALTTLTIGSISANADEPYRILITNDDGITDAGLIALVDALSDNAEIIVAAPAVKWGGKGHGTNLWEGPMKIEPQQISGASHSYAVYGMPADAARFGILMANKLGKKIDLVISGINSGDNVGSASQLSGTIGAAMEALYYKIPSIAVSLDGDTAHKGSYGDAAHFIDTLVPEIRKNGIPEGTMLNINIPATIKGVKATPQGDYVVEVSSFEITEDGMFTPQITYPDSKIPGSDSYEFTQGYITIAPLKLDNTDAEMLKTLGSWNLKTGK